MPNIAYLDFTYDKSSIMTDSVNMPLTFISRENNNTIKIIRENCPTNLYKSLDGGMTWSAVSYTDNASLQYSGRELGTLNKGQYVMLKGSFNGAWNENPTSWNVSSFSSTGKFDIIGNIMSIAPGMTNNAMPEISHIFDNIFSETKVVDASKLILPATTLYEYCYREMFKNCIYLTSAPELPATILATECYGGMFNGCTSLVNMPDLSATSLATGCCIGMFENCTSLYEAPKLPATTLASSCYLNMFNGCTSMVKPPALPATTLAWGCYNGMFQGCTSITDAPELKADTVPNYAYANMFYNCTSLNYIKIHATNREAQSIYNWVHNVAPTGIFIKHKNATYDIDSDSGVPIGWTVFDLDETIGEVYTVTISTTPSDTGSVIGAGRYRAGATVTLTGQPATGYKVKQYSKYTSPTTTEVVSTYNNSYQFVIKEDTHILAEFELDSEFNDYESVYFTITSLEDNNSIYFRIANPDLNDLEVDDFELSYSINNRPWESMTLTFDTESESHYEQDVLITTINEGDNIRFRADRDTYVTHTPEYAGGTQVSGIRRFITSKQYKVSGNILSLLYASDNDKSDRYKFYYYKNASIPNGCFSNLFYNDQNLVDATSLIIPDVTIGTDSFYNCFADCRSLVKTPAILYPSTLAQSCYTRMFAGCSAINEAPELPALTLADFCYREMFWYASLIYPPELPATILTDGCYYQMFAYCESLLIQPRLNATTLTWACYYEMFAGCTSLIGYPNGYATTGDVIVTLDDSSCAGMFQDCTSIEEAIIQTNCVGKMPNSNVGVNCCEEMFRGCTNLKTIRIGGATTKISPAWDSSNSPTLDWVHNVAPTGTFYKNSNLDWPIDSDNGIPIGWTAVNVNTELWDFNVYNSNNTAGYITKSPNRDLVADNTEVTVTATVLDNGFTFVGWKKNDGTYASNNSTYTFTATEDINLTAMWSGETRKYTVTVVNSNPSAGSATNSARYNAGETVTLVATPYNGYNFTKWVCTTNGTEYRNPQITFTVTSDMNFVVYFEEDIDYEHEYFTVESQSNNNILRISFLLGGPNGDGHTEVEPQTGTYITTEEDIKFTLEYKKNNDTFWTKTNVNDLIQKHIYSYAMGGGHIWQYNYYIYEFSLNNGEKISIRNIRDIGGTVGDLHKYKISCYYNYKVYGNINSLNWALTDSSSTYNYYVCDRNQPSGHLKEMFDGSTYLYNYNKLTDASNLVLKYTFSNCYERMFYNCTLLNAAPELPATTLAEGCYCEMFEKCTSLTDAPVLPATTLVSICYSNMFNGCTSLNYIKCLATNVSSSEYTADWVKNVASTGTFIKSPNATWDSGDDGIPSGWTAQNAS